MPGFLNRLAAPIVFLALVLIATVTMVRDRGEISGEDRRDLPWWRGMLLEVAIPIQRAEAAPFDALGDAWSR